MKNYAQRAEQILQKHYARRLVPEEGGGYVASILEFPGLVADGDTVEEALENLERAAKSWLEVALANGQDVRDPVDFNGYSGKVALRLPRSIHSQASQMAEQEGVSLNQFLVAAIAHYLGGKQLFDKVIQQPRFQFENVAVVALGFEPGTVLNVHPPILGRATSSSSPTFEIGGRDLRLINPQIQNENLGLEH